MSTLKELSRVQLPRIAGGVDEGTEWCTSPLGDAPFGYYFGLACMRHDQNYSSASTMTRQQADTQFYVDLHQVCEVAYDDDLLCNITADVYYLGVSMFGSLFYEGPGSLPPPSNWFMNPATGVAEYHQPDGSGGSYDQIGNGYLTHTDAFGHQWDVVGNLDFTFYNMWHHQGALDPGAMENLYLENCCNYSLEEIYAIQAFWAQDLASGMVGIMYADTLDVTAFVTCAAQLSELALHPDYGALEIATPDGGTVTVDQLLLAAGALAAAAAERGDVGGVIVAPTTPPAPAPPPNDPPPSDPPPTDPYGGGCTGGYNGWCP